MKTSSAAASHYHHHHHHKFSQRCHLLRQYMKEYGSIRDLSLGLSLAKPHRLETKNLLAMIDKCGQNQDTPIEGKAEMTIFYNGQVIVFNEFSQQKAKEIMDFASQVSGTNENKSASTTKISSSILFRNWARGMSLSSGLMSSQPLCEGDMPIMRNASLARFIAKRKDRIRASAPYQIKNSNASSSSSSTSSIQDNSKTWLGL